MQMEEVFDITDTAVLVLEELVMWFALVGHIVPPYCDLEPPSCQLQGNCPLWGEPSVGLAPEWTQVNMPEFPPHLKLHFLLCN